MSEVTLYWVDSSRIPGDRASSKQVVKTCNALGGLCEVVLLTPQWKADTRNYNEDIRKHFSLGDMRFQLVRVPFPWSKFYLFNFFSLMILLRELGRKRRPLLIYTRGLNAAVMFKKILSNKARVVCELHPLPLTSVPKDVVRLDGIVAVTKELREDMIREHGVKEDNIIVEPCAVDLSEFQLQEDVKHSIENKIRECFGSDRRLVMYAGQLYGSKKTMILLDLAAFLKERNENIKILIVGGWEDEPEIHAFKKEIQCRHLESFIKVEGHKPYSMIPYYLHCADVLFLTDIGAKFFEYCAARKPIVAADTALMREWAGENEVYFYRQEELLSCYRAVMQALDDKGKKSSRSFAFVQNHTFALRAKRIYDFMMSLYLKP